MNAISKSIELTPRDQHFHFEANGRRDWHGGDPVKSIFFNALSVTFPEGEKFFMETVKNFRNDIEDPVLQKQIKAFLVQEAMHTREHVSYNKELDAQGYRATEAHLRSRERLNLARKYLSKKAQLSVTVAMEHYTATFADVLMKHPQFLAGADEEFRKVWLWHAMEEAEHKGVAFDVYQHVTGGKAYFQRCRVMFLIMMRFHFAMFQTIREMMQDVGISRSAKSWFGIVNFLFGKPGLYRHMALPMLAYFKPGFHPWQDDNRAEIAKWEKELTGVEAATAA